MAKKALILIANGTEEMEYTITYDTLVRAGVQCTSASIQSGPEGTSPVPVVCSRGVKILPDTILQPLNAGPDTYDALVIPGGLKGAVTLAQSSEVQSLVKAYYEGNKIVAMICAASQIAKAAGLPRQPVTSYPLIKDELASHYDYKEESVVVSNLPGKGTLVTRCVDTLLVRLDDDAVQSWTRDHIPVCVHAGGAALWRGGEGGRARANGVPAWHCLSVLIDVLRTRVCLLQNCRMALRWLQAGRGWAGHFKHRRRLFAMAFTPVSHADTNSPAAWRDALAATPAAPASFELIKTLVYKPKTAKTAVPVPVVVIARDETETSSSALARRLNLKELRLASEDLLSEFFGLDKNALSPLALNKETFSKVVTVIDASIVSSEATFAVHACSASATVFLSGKDVAAYLRDLETEAVKVEEVDFAALKTDAPAAKPVAKEKEDAKIEGAVQIAIGVKKEIDFSAWYQNVLMKADMLEYYSVSGCYILRPWSYSIWEEIQDWFNKRIKAMGVQNASFPMFVSSKVLEREKDHVEGFSPEVAWVTRAGSSELEEPIAIRPTSETVMYPYYAKWIKSHRDLPLKLNLWNNVVRWEFKHPQPFLRTREYLWQEGHTAHLTKAEADKEVLEILELYRRCYEELLAVPMIKGVKSEKEKFAGALYTTTVEGFIPASGRGIQAGTSHCLGQNFSRAEMFNIVVEDPSDPTGQGKTYAWQNSWGLSTRTIGIMVMVHGDNQGLVLPPRVASIQVIVVPCGITAKTSDEDRNKINDACDELAKSLVDVGVRAKADLRDGYTPGYKFNDWEQKGVPLRLEIGPNDLVKQQTLSVRRDTGDKAPIALADLKATVPQLLETIHRDMYQRALDEYNAHVKEVTRWEDFVPTLDNKCIAIIPWCEREACEDDIKERSGRSAEPQDERAPSAGAKSLAIPFEQERFTPIEHGKTKCVGCGQDAKRWTMFGRSY